MIYEQKTKLRRRKRVVAPVIDHKGINFQNFKKYSTINLFSEISGAF